MKVGIFLFPDVETLDFAGPLEVFSAANIACEEAHFDVYTFAQTKDTIVTRNGLWVLPHYDFSDVPHPDVLVIPGGDGTKTLIESQEILNQISKFHTLATYSFTVCSGARIAALLGWLDGKTFTTHHLVFDDVQKLAPTAKVRPYKRFVDEGKVLTSAGVSAGIDLSLYLVEKIKGKVVKEKAARYMEY